MRKRNVTRYLFAMVLLLGCSPLSTVEVEESKTSRDASKVAEPKPPPTPQAVDDAIERGVAFLLAVQNKNGSWGSAHNTKDLNIYAPVPGAHHAFRTAVSAMCLSAHRRGTYCSFFSRLNALSS